MGITSGSNILYRLTNLSLEDILLVVRSRQKDRFPNIENEYIPLPTIDIDASWVVRSCNNTSGSHVGYLCRIALFLCNNGFDVVVVCDGDIRHHSKQSTMKRMADCYRDMITIRKNRITLNDFSNRIEETNDIAERDLLQKDRDTLLSKTSSLERKKTQAKVSVGDDMYRQLLQLLQSSIGTEIGTYKAKVSVMKAEYQADSMMAARLVRGETDILLSSDSDLAALTGHQYLAIKSFNFKDSPVNGSFKDLELSVTCLYHINNICTTINLVRNNDQDKRKLKLPRYPLFEQIANPKLRVLTAIGIGTDYYLGGVPKVGPKTVSDHLESIYKNVCTLSENQVFDSMIRMFVTKYKKERDKVLGCVSDLNIQDEYERMLRVYVDTMLYEPGNEVTPMHQSNIYIHGNEPPTSLHPYIYDFARNDPNIVTSSTVGWSVEDLLSCDLLTCVGPGVSHSHPFFRLDGTNTECFSCNETICRFCTFTCIDKKENYCIRCYAKETLVGDIADVRDLPSRPEMMNILRSKGHHVNHDDTIDFVMDLFEAVVNNGDLISEDTLNKVKYPLECSTYLQNFVTISDFPIKYGGSFINNNNLSLQDNINVLNILVALVDVEKVHSTFFPKMIIRFASDSRVHVGERLLKRTLLHAMDNDSSDLRDAESKLVMYKNQMSVYIKHKMRASMRDCTYQVEVLFNQHDLISCSCNCKVGSCGEERVICIHIFPVLYQFYILMYEGLARHVIEELAHYVTSNVDHLHQEMNDMLLTIAKRLFCVIGYTYTGSSADISDVLETFKVGTERPKFGPSKAKDSTKACPARDLDMRSNAKRATDKTLVTEESVSANVVSSVEQEIETIDLDTYNKMVEHIVVMTSLLKADTKFLQERIGFQLLLHRSKYSRWNIAVSSEVLNQWIDLFEIANRKERVSKRKSDVLENSNEDSDDMNVPEVVNTTNVFATNTRTTRSSNTKIANYTCCICGDTSIKNRLLKFQRVPNVLGYKTLKNDRFRFSYYKKKFRRNIYLNRMQIVGNKRRKLEGLRFCSQHTTRKETFMIPWINMKKERKVTEAIIEVPVEENADDEVMVVTPESVFMFDCSVDIDDETESLKEVSRVLVEIKNANNIQNDNNLQNDTSEDDSSYHFSNANSNDDLFGSVNDDSSDCSTDTNENNNEIMQHNDDYASESSSYDSTYKEDNSSNDELNGSLDDDTTDDECAINDNIENDMDCLPVVETNKKWNHRIMCCYKNCNKKGVPLKQIQPPIKESTTASKRNHDRMVNTIKQNFRNECLERIGVQNPKKDTRQSIRICHNHKIETITNNVEWISHYMIKKHMTTTKENIKVTMNVPVRFECRDKALYNHHRYNRGNGESRFALQQLSEATTIMETSQNPIERAHVKEMLDLQRHYAFDHMTVEGEFMNDMISNTIGLTKQSSCEDNTRIEVLYYNGIRGGKNNNKSIPNNNDDDSSESINNNSNNNKMKTKVRLDKQQNKITKEETGYGSIAEIIACGIIYSNGDINKLKQQCTYLTWLEELYFFETKMYGRVTKRWYDASRLFDVSETSAIKIFDSKIKLCLRTMKSWPTYATHEEDMMYRNNNKWGALEYTTKRIVMWDNTNSDITKPGNRNNQALTWSSYYNGNCCKGSVFAQLCCWMGTGELWTGSITDSDYMIKSGILERQQQWIDHHPIEKHIPWYNITDKGYRISYESWTNGNQHVLQPVFGRNGQAFTTNETLLSAAIAKIRSGNERAVNIVKHYKYVCDGLNTNESIVRLADAWLVAGFSANFKYGKYQ